MNQQNLTAAQRLFVAADFDPNPDHADAADSVMDQVRNLAHQLSELKGICLKVNSALRANHYESILDIQELDLRVFADLKLNDIGETLAKDGKLLRAYGPELLTVMCNTGPAAINALQEYLPETEIVGVTILTSLTEEDVQDMYVTDIQSAVLRLIDLTLRKTNVRSFVCSAAEAPMIRSRFGDDISLITPGIRFADVSVQNDDQNQKRVMTAMRAIQNGATCIVVGRPILDADDRLAAAKRMLAEIETAIP